MPPWSLPVTVLAGSLALTACGGGGGGSSSPPTSQPLSSTSQQTLPPGAPLVSDQHFHYNLNRAGQVPITETGSRELDWTTSDLRQLDGTEDTSTRDDFNTVVGSLADDSAFTRYGFWGQHGYAAVVLGEESSQQITDTERTWSGPFHTAHAWAAGETTDANPTGTGSASWRGIAEAASTADFQRLTGTANLTIPDLSQPRLTAAIDLDKTDGSTAALRWSDISLSNGSFSQGSAGDDHIHGRFHGQDHSEAWGIFHTNAYLGAFGAMRQLQQ